MADRSFHTGPEALDIGTVTLWARATIGASGAITASRLGNGVASVVRTSAGLYTVTLQDIYTSLQWAEVKVLAASAGNPTTAGILNTLQADTVATSTPTVAFLFQSVTAGAATDPASGAILYFKIELKNSSV